MGTGLRVVRTRLERARREAALIAGTSCEFCGDTERVEPRRMCYCGDTKPMAFSSVLRATEAGDPICTECWSGATIHRMCEGCRYRGGEEVGA